MPGGIDEANDLGGTTVLLGVHRAHFDLCFDLENCSGECATMQILQKLWDHATSVERERCYAIAKNHRPHSGRAVMAQKEATDCVADQILAITDNLEW